MRVVGVHTRRNKIKEAHTKIESQETTKRNSAECGQYNKIFSFWKSASGRFYLVHLQPPQLHQFKTLFFSSHFSTISFKKIRIFPSFLWCPTSKKLLGNIPPHPHDTEHKSRVLWSTLLSSFFGLYVYAIHSN